MFLILEAKDHVRKLLATRGTGASSRHEQLEKSMAVFTKEVARIDRLIELRIVPAISDGSLGEYAILTGYVFPATNGSLSANRSQLYSLHSRLALEADEERLLPCISLIVDRHPNDDLSVSYALDGVEATMGARLAQAFPSAVTPH
jgi:hypothetical protein